MKTKLLKKLRQDAIKAYNDVLYVHGRGWCIYGTESLFPYPNGKVILKYQSLNNDKKRAQDRLDFSRREYIVERVEKMKDNKEF